MFDSNKVEVQELDEPEQKEICGGDSILAASDSDDCETSESFRVIAGGGSF